MPIRIKRSEELPDMTLTRSQYRSHISGFGMVLFFTVCSASTVLHAGDSVVRGDLQWSVKTNGEFVAWAAADAYCDGLRLDGHDDWRLPTLPELETLHDPGAANGQGIVAPIELDGCCVWSRSTLFDVAADGDSPTSGKREDYRWGFLFDGGIRYYSYFTISDGAALCVRDVNP